MSSGTAPPASEAEAASNDLAARRRGLNLRAYGSAPAATSSSTSGALRLAGSARCSGRPLPASLMRTAFTSPTSTSAASSGFGGAGPLSTAAAGILMVGGPG